MKTSNEKSSPDKDTSSPKQGALPWTAKPGNYSNMGTLTMAHAGKEEQHHSQLKNLQERKVRNTEQLARIEKTMADIEAKLSFMQVENPDWISGIVSKIAKEFETAFPGTTATIITIGNDAAITLSKPATDKAKAESKAITLVPVDLAKGKLGVRSFETDLKLFPRGSAKDLAGENFAVIELDMEKTSVRELAQHLR
jgi:hypothetical protein